MLPTEAWEVPGESSTVNCPLSEHLANFILSLWQGVGWVFAAGAIPEAAPWVDGMAAEPFCLS